MTIAVGDEHKQALDEIIAKDPIFPPTRSEIAALSILVLRDKIREGEISLPQVYEKYVASPVCNVG